MREYALVFLVAAAVTYLLTVASVALGVVVSFGARYLANLAAFWWLDARGANTVWLICSTMLSGLAVPVAFFPEWARLVVWAATPFPWMFQAPLDILLERGGGGHQAVLLAGQLVAAVAVLVAGRVVQRAAVRTLVVQGG